MKCNDNLQQCLANEGVINSISQQKKYAYDYFCHVLDPDWDVIVHIVQII